MAIQRKEVKDLGRKSYDFPGGTINWREVVADPVVEEDDPTRWPGIFGKVETEQIIRRDTCGSKQTVMGRSVYHPGDHHEPHVHFYAEEVMYCLSGKAVVGTGDKEYIFKEGDVQFSKIGEVHWLRNPFDEPVEFIWVYSGASMPMESGYATSEIFDEGMEIYKSSQEVE